MWPLILTHCRERNQHFSENDRVDIGEKRALQLAKAFGVHPAIIMFPEYEAKEISKVADLPLPTARTHPTNQSKNGHGGDARIAQMNGVYRAEDTNLSREVAIRVLPEYVASDPGLKQRFEREARTGA